MTMSPAIRKLMLTGHVTFSVGWLGAAAAYVALAVTAVASHDGESVRSAYFGMELTGWFIIVPLCLASLTTGLVQSLGTEWGLFRHYWVLIKFVLTVVATIILLLHMPAVSRMAAPFSEIIHAGGGVLVLLTAIALSVYKPWGRTAWHRARCKQETVVSAASFAWGRYALVAAIGLGLLLLALHLIQGGHGGHGH
jgi:hypothetical protein